MEWDLLEKTTFWIEGIELEAADLGELAGAAAGALGMKPDEILVVDVRPGLVAFDVLRRQIEAEAVAGKESKLLQCLSALSGVKIEPGAAVHSEGVLGLIALGEKEAAQVLTESARMAVGIAEAVSRRAMVFASGREVMAGEIRDTNSPYIIQALQRAGFEARFGGVLEDDARNSAICLEAVLEQGYGLLVTTGGVGAEDKDFSVEAICRLDPAASTPWILRFKPDYHRHHKKGVRIGVGRVGAAIMVALPGPHEEAKLGCDRLIDGLRARLDKDALAEHIAAGLRERWQKAMTGRDIN